MPLLPGLRSVPLHNSSCWFAPKRKTVPPHTRKWRQSQYTPNEIFCCFFSLSSYSPLHLPVSWHLSPLYNGNLQWTPSGGKLTAWLCHYGIENCYATLFIPQPRFFRSLTPSGGKLTAWLCHYGIENCYATLIISSFFWKIQWIASKNAVTNHDISRAACTLPDSPE